MRKTLLAAAAAFVIGGASVGSLISYAQPAPPPGPGGAGPDGWRHHGMMERLHHWREHRLFAPGTFALIHRQADRNLSPADVQKIAEAFLLWNGNHTWKVIDVAAASDGAIKFSLATAEGSVVASFTMDPHSGHIDRTS